MALAEQELERLVEDARDTVSRNENAIRAADARAEELRAAARRSRRTIESVNRRLRKAGLREAAEA
jgi:hypothetical protein